MLRPAMSQIIREGESYYAFVVAVARHAREIADYWADNGLPMEKKPVTASLEDFASGKVRVRATGGTAETLRNNQTQTAHAVRRFL